MCKIRKLSDIFCCTPDISLLCNLKSNLENKVKQKCLLQLIIETNINFAQFNAISILK